MSRMGKVPIKTPDKVRLVAEKGSIKCEGPKGKLAFAHKPWVSLREEKGEFWVDRKDDSSQSKAHQGLLHAMLKNMIKGVTEGFTKNLDMVGVGFKAEVSGHNLSLNIGFCHPVVYAFPADIAITVEKTSIKITGIDKQKVGQVAAEIRKLRVPDNYKGKGIRYQGEQVKLKAGKSAVGSGF